MLEKCEKGSVDAVLAELVAGSTEKLQGEMEVEEEEVAEEEEETNVSDAKVEDNEKTCDNSPVATEVKVKERRKISRT